MLSVFLAAVPILAALSDGRSFVPPDAYEKVLADFLHGHLAMAQQEAEQGYQRSLTSHPEWSRRFQLLDATALSWQGRNSELMLLLANRPSDIVGPLQARADDSIKEHAIEATALTRLNRLDEASEKLVEADSLCGKTPSTECGEVLRAHGTLLMERDQLDGARVAFGQARDFAQIHKDQLLEGTALLGLANVASQQERHDQALNLYQSAYQAAIALNDEDLELNALGGEGYEYYGLGNVEKAIELYAIAEKRAAALGNTKSEIQILLLEALVYSDTNQMALAEEADLRVIKFARQTSHQQILINTVQDLAQVYLKEGKLKSAEGLAGEALVLARGSGNQLDILNCHLIEGEAAAARTDWARATALLTEVSNASESQPSMRWTAQHTLATSFEAQGQTAAAGQAYEAAIAFVETARGDVNQELSQLTFLNNAARIYDDYIHFLVAQGRTDEALEAADWSRARTLQQGLGLISASASVKPPPLRAPRIARATNTTLLFYWLGERQSYLWAVTPEKMTVVQLPAKAVIVAKMQRYRRTLLALKDPLRANAGQGDTDGRELYDTLIAPVSGIADPIRPVVLFTDGEMTQLNFETLIAGSPAPHYWIEDATVSSSPSLRLFATRNKIAALSEDKLLLLGDAATADPAYPALPMAALEVTKVRGNFSPSDQIVFSGARATPRTYLASKPEQFSYIHFVAHATASTADPLESAVILSRDGAGDGSYKLYAREILRHPIAARLVTISACNSSGTKSYTGEGVVGLSWAFLRAGAHNTIGALWEVSDGSTPELMDHLYGGLEQRQPPATALRNAKLSLLHSGGNFSRPFFWAPFQLYSGR